MADQEDKKKPKRPPRRKPAKKASNSKISEAQQAAVKARKERDSLRAQSAAMAAARTTNSDPNSIRPPGAQPGIQVPGGTAKGAPATTKPGVPSAKGTMPDRTKTSGPGDSGPIRDPLLQGLTTIANTPARPLADPSLYGNGSASREANIRRMREAADATKKRLLSKNDNAVYMGPGQAKYRRSGPRRMDENGSDVEIIAAGDDIQTKDELMSWLSDPLKVEEIKKRAQAAGLNVQSFDDISKLWESVVNQAATTFSRTSKKVTPWALLEMRGKYAGPNGKMQDKITTSTQIDEMDPAEARGLFEQTATNMLGRAPSQAELDDFIAKAQMIARENPAISTTRSKVGFDGEVEEGTSQTVTKGGAQVVNAKAQMAAQDMAKQDEEYGAYQAAGTYFPLLFDALSSPV